MSAKSNPLSRGPFSCYYIVMKVGILQPSYLPWLGFFEQLASVDTFVIYDDVQYTKNDWRNRNRIKTQHGVKWLTVPALTGGRFGELIKDVRIDDSKDWRKDHLATINFAYARAPFFGQYFPKLEKIILGSGDSLRELNLALIRWLAGELGIKTKIVLSSELNIPNTGKTQRLIDICKQLGATYFYEGAAGRNYINESEFNSSGIMIAFQDYKHPVYHQLYGDFVPHLSVIDLLFNEGPRSLEIILGK